MRKHTVGILAVAALFAGTPPGAWGVPRTWVGGAAGDWFAGTNWDPAGVPEAGDDVTIATAGATVSLAGTAPASGSFNSFAISGTATLSFSNWDTELRAEGVTIGNQAVLTCAGPFTDAQMSNRVAVVCTDFTLASGGKIELNVKGYAAGSGPGKGLAAGQGGGHGGQGQTSTFAPGGAPYGTAEAPIYPGSGGFATSGSAGGGALRIAAAGHVILNGSITANGGDNVTAPGSGGAVYISCTSFAGTNGTVSANGGGPGNSSGNGGGGGGRIAVVYDPLEQAALPVPQVTFSATAGKRLNHALNEFPFRGDLGTLHLADASWLTATIPHSGRLVIPDLTSWTTPSLTVNGWVRFPGEDFVLTVADDVLVSGQHARLELGAEQWTNRAVFTGWCNPANGPTLTVGGNLALASQGSLVIHAGETNGTPGDWGALLDVTGTVSLAANSWITPVSHPTNGGSLLIRCASLLVPANSGFSASGRGYAAGYGPGRGLGAAQGGGHGGQGQTESGRAGGAPYGCAEAPTTPGSGGYASGGSAGGGVVRVEAQGAVVINGVVAANGGDNVSAPGAGGSVFITCATLAGTNGTVSANGGGPLNSSGNGGGGGGRIAVVYDTEQQAELPVPRVLLSAIPGVRLNHALNEYPFRGDLGTVYLPDTAWLTDTPALGGRLVIPGFTSWTPPALTVTNWLRFPAEGFALTVGGNLVVSGQFARLDLGSEAWTNRAAFNNYSNPTNGPALSVGGDLVLAAKGSLLVHAGETNGTPGDAGARVDVAGSVRIGSESWIIPVSHPVNGGSVLFRCHTMTVATNAGFSAAGRGWAGGYLGNGHGPGRGVGANAGAGYGGLGLNGANQPSGAKYGSEEAPLDAGSGGALSGGRAGNGGGSVRVEVARTLTLNGGTVNADAATDGSMNVIGSGGGGSGGGILLICRAIAGYGRLTARGMSSTSSNTGVGGGGRIAVRFRKDLTEGRVRNNADVSGGKVNPQPTRIAGEGTVAWVQIPATGTQVILR